MAFWAYMLKCNDDSYYVGQTDNLEKRIAEHQSGTFKGYTFSRRPVELIWSEYFVERAESLAAEAKIKGWSRAKKEALIAGDWNKISHLSRRRSNPSNPSTFRPGQSGPAVVSGQAEMNTIKKPFNYLIIADHASNRLPPEIDDLGVSADDMERHIAWDIGTELLAMRLQSLLKCPSIIAEWSRLLIDLNRDPKHPGLVPETSDGTTIPFNVAMSAAEKMQRMQAYFAPYHQSISQTVDSLENPFLIALHSFTPDMNGTRRPWEIGFLWNKDQRWGLAAAAAMARQHPQRVVGLNQPYSGIALNYTMDRHAENHGLPYLSIEIRQDLLATPADIAVWADRIAGMLAEVAQLV
jgi:predicted N-formylglutamate amidohydrolase/predicted GIY-YIG superfamily endonuclease